METLTLTEMEAIAGGGWLDFIDGVCAGVAFVAVVTAGASAANPVGGSVLAGCAVYGFGRVFMS